MKINKLHSKYIVIESDDNRWCATIYKSIDETQKWNVRYSRDGETKHFALQRRKTRREAISMAKTFIEINSN